MEVHNDDLADAQALERDVLGGPVTSMTCGCVLRIKEEHPTRPWVFGLRPIYRCAAHDRENVSLTWKWIDRGGRLVERDELHHAFLEAAVAPPPEDAVLIGRLGGLIFPNGGVLRLLGAVVPETLLRVPELAPGSVVSEYWLRFKLGRRLVREI